MPIIKNQKKPDNKIVLIDEKLSVPDKVPKFSRKKVLDSEKLDDKSKISAPKGEEGFCQDLLIGGFVQSYVDFYHLTHRIDPTGSGLEGSSVSKIETSILDMQFIRDNLVSAEICRRQGNTKGVYQAYNKLADFYAGLMDWRTSIFFHEKCLEVSQLTTDIRAEMSANHELGCVYQKNEFI